jgi:esterase
MKLNYKLYPCTSSDAPKHLFILHGLFGMLDNWHNIARKLSEEYTVISIDQRNHGNSPHSEEMSFELMADDLAELMDDLQIATAAIMGHSMGGKTVMRFADLHPDKLNKLIVVDISPRGYKSGHDAYFKAFNTIDFSVCQNRNEADAALAVIEPNAGVRQFLLKNLDRSEKGYHLKFNLKPIESFYPQMISALDFQWLINAPTLFIYGENSGYITGDDILTIEHTFTQASFIEITDAGHWIHAEQPKAFLEAVETFLAD